MAKPQRTDFLANVATSGIVQPRPAELAAVSPGGRIEFRLQWELVNYNSRNRNAHWATKNKGRKLWQARICNALVTALGMAGAQQLLAPESGLFGAYGRGFGDRRRLDITRLVPSRRNFIRDTFDNLPWATKELRDAVKNCGLIRDDSSKWTDTVITQDLSSDGSYWTWIAIDHPEQKES